MNRIGNVPHGRACPVVCLATGCGGLSPAGPARCGVIVEMLDAGFSGVIALVPGRSEPSDRDPLSHEQELAPQPRGRSPVCRVALFVRGSPPLLSRGLGTAAGGGSGLETEGGIQHGRDRARHDCRHRPKDTTTKSRCKACQPLPRPGPINCSSMDWAPRSIRG